MGWSRGHSYYWYFGRLYQGLLLWDYPGTSCLIEGEVPIIWKTTLQRAGTVMTSFSCEARSGVARTFSDQNEEEIIRIWEKLRKINQNLRKEWGKWNSCPAWDCETGYGPGSTWILVPNKPSFHWVYVVCLEAIIGLWRFTVAGYWQNINILLGQSMCGGYYVEQGKGT